MYILNIEEHLRSRLENFLVVQIIKSCDISEFGLEKCFLRLTEDLNELVKNGIDLPGLGMAYPVRVAQYRGDNKGTSHLMPFFCIPRWCTTKTRFQYRGPKPSSNFGICIGAVKTFCSQTETFFKKYSHVFPLLSWGYKF